MQLLNGPSVEFWEVQVGDHDAIAETRTLLDDPERTGLTLASAAMRSALLDILECPWCFLSHSLTLHPTVGNTARFVRDISYVADAIGVAPSAMV